MAAKFLIDREPYPVDLTSCRGTGSLYVLEFSCKWELTRVVAKACLESVATIAKVNSIISPVANQAERFCDAWERLEYLNQECMNRCLSRSLYSFHTDAFEVAKQPIHPFDLAAYARVPEARWLPGSQPSLTPRIRIGVTIGSNPDKCVCSVWSQKLI